jgi:DNA-binding LytR/AlgR family response regulator
MKNIRCIIVDDEPVARKIIQEFVEKTPSLEVSGMFENAPKASAFLKQHEVNLLFVDIEMPEVNGLEFVKSLSVRPMVIVTTAFPEYALDGYALDIMDYLLKPIAYARFAAAVEKAKEYLGLKRLEDAHRRSDYLFVRCEKRIEKLQLNDILYIESAGNYVHIHSSKKVLIAYLTLKGIEDQLSSIEFVKTHQSFLVNFSKITAIEGNVVVVGEKAIPISRNYREELISLVEKRLLKR